MNFRFSKHADRGNGARRGFLVISWKACWQLQKMIDTESLICARHGNGTASPPTVVTGLPDEQDREML